MSSKTALTNAYDEGRYDALYGTTPKAHTRGWSNSDTYQAYYIGYNSTWRGNTKDHRILVQGCLFDAN